MISGMIEIKDHVSWIVLLNKRKPFLRKPRYEYEIHNDLIGFVTRGSAPTLDEAERQIKDILKEF